MSAASMHFAPEWLKPRKPSRTPSATALGGGTTSNGLLNNPGGAFNSLSIHNADNSNTRSTDDDPGSILSNSAISSAHATTKGTTYSSLLSGHRMPSPDSTRPEDPAHPFRYSKEQMLKVWKDGGGRGSLGLEVERWPGVVREAGTDPLGLKEWTLEEKKAFSQGINSTHTGTHPSHPTRRHSQAHGISIATAGASAASKAFGGGGTGGIGSPRTERFGSVGSLGSPGTGSTLHSALGGRRRKDDSGDPASIGVYRPRQLSINLGGGSTLNSNGLLNSPAVGSFGIPPSPGGPLPSPRPRFGHSSSGFDGGVLGGSESWIRGKKVGDSRSTLVTTEESAHDEVGETHTDGIAVGTDGGGVDHTETTELANSSTLHHEAPQPSDGDLYPDSQQQSLQSAFLHSDLLPQQQQTNDLLTMTSNHPGGTIPLQSQHHIPVLPSVTVYTNEQVKWRYKDQQDLIQGPFDAGMMQQWYEAAYFTPDLLIQRHTPPLDPNNPDAFETLAQYKGKLPIASQPHLFLKGMELVTAPPPNLPLPLSLAATQVAPGAFRSASPYTPQRTNSGLSLGVGVTSSYQNSPVLPPFQAQPLPQHQQPLGSDLSSLRNVQPIRTASFDLLANSSAAPSPAFANALVQPYGGIGSGLSAEDRQRLEREEYFAQLREREIVTSGRNSAVGMYGAVLGGSQGQGVPVRSSGYRPATPLAYGSATVSDSPTQSALLHSLNIGTPTTPSNVGPRLAQFQQGQPQQAPATPYQQTSQVQPHAWNLVPNVIRGSPVVQNLAPIPLPKNDEQLATPGWGPGVTGGMSDPFISQQPQTLDAWQPQQAYPEQQQQHQRPNRQERAPPIDTIRLNEQYSTATTMQQVQAQQAGNFGLPNGFVDPKSLPEFASAAAPTPTPIQVPASQPQQLTPATEASVAPSDEPLQPTADILPPKPLSPVNATESPTDATPPSPSLPLKTSASSSIPAEPVRTTSKSSTKTEPTSATAATPVDEPVATPTPVPSKPVWATPVSSTAAGAAASLREIQEAEAKRAEARKNAEREKEKALRAAAAATTTTAAVPVVTVDEAIPKSTSWGLPQVGQHRTGGSTTSSTAATTGSGTTLMSGSSVTTTVPAAWATASTAKIGGAKKTMKEIQEEEERKKKAQGASAAGGDGFSSAAGRKAYVDTAKAVEAAKANANSGPWVTVGGNGKSVAGSSPAAVSPSALSQTRPAVTTPARSAASVVTGASQAARPTPSTTASAASVIASQPKIDDKVAPSPEFIKWTKEALRGLSGVNVDDFITMLFDFPMDPDASTLEIISEFVYVNSSTLDGRRFASEFVSKRKADARARTGNKAATGKSVSVADVVKTQPKPVQTEWAYKVVTKKKGKRS